MTIEIKTNSTYSAAGMIPKGLMRPIQPSPSPTAVEHETPMEPEQAQRLTEALNHPYQFECLDKNNQRIGGLHKFNINNFSDLCVKNLGLKNFHVKSINVKGGIINHLIRNYPIENLQDIDLEIILDSSKRNLSNISYDNWLEMEQILLNSFAECCEINDEDKKKEMLARGEGRKAVHFIDANGLGDRYIPKKNRDSSYSSHKIPLIREDGQKQSLDINIVAIQKHSCTSSYDCLRAEGSRLKWISDGPFDVHHALEDVTTNKTRFDPEWTQNCRNPWLRYLLQLTRGTQIDDISSETAVYLRYTTQMRSWDDEQREVNNILVKHFENNPRGQILFLFNYLKFVERANSPYYKEPPFEKEQIYDFIASQLGKILNMSDNDIEDLKRKPDVLDLAFFSLFLSPLAWAEAISTQDSSKKLLFSPFSPFEKLVSEMPGDDFYQTLFARSEIVPTGEAPQFMEVLEKLLKKLHETFPHQDTTIIQRLFKEARSRKIDASPTGQPKMLPPKRHTPSPRKSPSMSMTSYLKSFLPQNTLGIADEIIDKLKAGTYFDSREPIEIFESQKLLSHLFDTLVKKHEFEKAYAVLITASPYIKNKFEFFNRLIENRKFELLPDLYQFLSKQESVTDSQLEMMRDAYARSNEVMQKSGFERMLFLWQTTLRGKKDLFVQLTLTEKRVFIEGLRRFPELRKEINSLISSENTHSISFLKEIRESLASNPLKTAEDFKILLNLFEMSIHAGETNLFSEMSPFEKTALQDGIRKYPIFHTEIATCLLYPFTKPEPISSPQVIQEFLIQLIENVKQETPAHQEEVFSYLDDIVGPRLFSDGRGQACAPLIQFYFSRWQTQNNDRLILKTYKELEEKILSLPVPQFLEIFQRYVQASQDKIDEHLVPICNGLDKLEAEASAEHNSAIITILWALSKDQKTLFKYPSLAELLVKLAPKFQEKNPRQLTINRLQSIKNYTAVRDRLEKNTLKIQQTKLSYDRLTKSKFNFKNAISSVQNCFDLDLTDPRSISVLQEQLPGISKVMEKQKSIIFSDENRNNRTTLFLINQAQIKMARDRFFNSEDGNEKAFLAKYISPLFQFLTRFHHHQDPIPSKENRVISYKDYLGAILQQSVREGILLPEVSVQIWEELCDRIKDPESYLHLIPHIGALLKREKNLASPLYQRLLKLIEQFPKFKTIAELPAVKEPEEGETLLNNFKLGLSSLIETIELTSDIELGLQNRIEKIKKEFFPLRGHYKNFLGASSSEERITLLSGIHSQFLEQENSEQAIAFYQKIINNIELSPDVQAITFFYLAEIIYEQSGIENTILDGISIIQLLDNPENPIKDNLPEGFQIRYLEMVADAHAFEKSEKALSYFEQLSKKGKPALQAKALNKIGLIHFEKENWTSAIAALEQSNRIEKLSPYSLKCLAHSYLEIEDNENAIKYYTGLPAEALAKEKKILIPAQKPMLSKGLTRSAGGFNFAEQKAVEKPAVDNAKLAQFFIGEAEKAVKDNRWADANRAYLAAILKGKTSLDDYKSISNLGKSFFELGEYNEAIQHLEFAIGFEEGSKDIELIKKLICSHFALGRYAAGVHFLKLVYQSAPKDPEIKKLLGRKELKKIPEAKELRQKIQQTQKT